MRGQLRPVLAAVLAMALPGLGHLLLRRWGRALLWHVTIIGGGLALFGLYDVSIDPSMTNPTEVAAALPTDVTLPIVLLYVISAVDAYLVGRADAAERDRAAAAETLRRRAASVNDDGAAGAAASAAVPDDEAGTVECPSCGKETDADIDFCHWCTEPLPWATEPAE
ncbi:zinc ribbon domain-containing protein [Halorubrum sp. CBA1125]|uniref:DUF7575 domain-containing protein n=1 Tax=Halorubrum sp. CBA1125 TaxID=2668072 RepID=UPI0012E71078|nr:zinc ribbon domain-containing protein [Halorubrum sp. CBA1125]MUW15466.1 zinc ribbon domain-containing protein [Halorubrum sp. CBA1125]